MILQGSQRGGPVALAKHLLNRIENDHVELHEVRGVAAEDLRGALCEIEATKGAARTNKVFYHLSLNPPPDARPSTADFESAIEAAEQHLGLVGQPRAVVFHEKYGRRHAHVAWSRINHDTGRTIRISYDRRWLQKLSISLYQQHGWTLPAGFRKGPSEDVHNLRQSKASPLNHGLDQWQQALRTGLTPAEHKKILHGLYHSSGDVGEFGRALTRQGYELAHGRRGFVAVDLDGEVHSVMRAAGERKKAVEAKLGDPRHLPDVEAAQEIVGRRRSQAIEQHIDQVKKTQTNQMVPYRRELDNLRHRQREERHDLASRQRDRTRQSETVWANRHRKGLLGFWDTLTGRRKRIAEEIHAERQVALKQARQEKDGLVQQHLDERRLLQAKAARLQQRHRQEILDVRRDIANLLTFDPGDLTTEHARRSQMERETEHLEQAQTQRQKRTQRQGVGRRRTRRLAPPATVVEQDRDPDAFRMG